MKESTKYAAFYISIILIVLAICFFSAWRDSKPKTIGQVCSQTAPTDDDHFSIWSSPLGHECATMFLGNDEKYYAHIFTTNEDAVFDSQAAAEYFVRNRPYRP